MSRLRELREQKVTIVQRGREIHERAVAENRDLSAEEEGQLDNIYGTGGDPNAEGISPEERNRRLGEVGRLDRRIELEERQLEAERKAAEDALRAKDEGRADPGGSAAPGNESRATPKYDEWQQGRDREFRSFLQSDRNGVYKFQTHDLDEGERRALEAGADVSGGYLLPAERFVQELIKAVDDMVFVRQAATVLPLTEADSLGVPSLDADPADADWTVELGTGSEDTAMSFGKRKLEPHPAAKIVRVSKTLIRKAMSAEGIVRDRLAYKRGITEEKGFLTGNGSGQPLGMFTASADGISTARDVSTGNTTTDIRFDGLIECKYSIKGAYWPRLQWMFHRDAVKRIAKLKDGEGQYIWQPSAQAGQPDRLLNVPFRVSEYVPNTFTTGLYVGLLGDLSFYWIADALSMELERLNELYAANNQVGFILRFETDGMPVLEEAFARVKLA